MFNPFTIFVYEPLYNVLVYIINTVPGGDVGVSIIVLTLAVKFAILPLTHKSVKANNKIKSIQGDITALKEKYSKDQKEQAARIMNLYKEHGINPFSGCLFAVIQIPVIFGLYWVFWKGLQEGIIQADILYSFVSVPEAINFSFINLIDLRDRSIVLAVLAGLSQFFQLQLTFPTLPKEKETKTKTKDISFSDELKKSFKTQARYVLPGVIFFVALSFPAAVPLYWVTSNIFSISHELLVKKKALQILTPKPEAP